MFSSSFEVKNSYSFDSSKWMDMFCRLGRDLSTSPLAYNNQNFIFTIYQKNSAYIYGMTYDGWRKLPLIEIAQITLDNLKYAAHDYGKIHVAAISILQKDLDEETQLKFRAILNITRANLTKQPENRFFDPQKWIGLFYTYVNEIKFFRNIREFSYSNYSICSKDGLYEYGPVKSGWKRLNIAEIAQITLDNLNSLAHENVKISEAVAILLKKDVDDVAAYRLQVILKAVSKSFDPHKWYDLFYRYGSDIRFMSINDFHETNYTLCVKDGIYDYGSVKDGWRKLTPAEIAKITLENITHYTQNYAKIGWVASLFLEKHLDAEASRLFTRIIGIAVTEPPEASGFTFKPAAANKPFDPHKWYDLFYRYGSDIRFMSINDFHETNYTLCEKDGIYDYGSVKDGWRKLTPAEIAKITLENITHYTQNYAKIGWVASLFLEKHLDAEASRLFTRILGIIKTEMPSKAPYTGFTFKPAAASYSEAANKPFDPHKWYDLFYSYGSDILYMSINEFHETDYTLCVKDGVYDYGSVKDGWKKLTPAEIAKITLENITHYTQNYAKIGWVASHFLEKKLDAEASRLFIRIIGITNPEMPSSAPYGRPSYRFNYSFNPSAAFRPEMDPSPRIPPKLIDRRKKLQGLFGITAGAATFESLTKAYRVWVIKNHPDRAPEKTELFKHVQNHWQELKELLEVSKLPENTKF